MKLIITFFIAALFLSGCDNNNSCGTKKTVDAKEASEIVGESLFKSNCASCHKCYGDIIGPGLHGSFERWGTKDSLIAFVQNSEPILQQNKYAIELKKKYDVSYIHRFTTLDSNQIKTIIYYCDFYKQ